MTTSSPLISIVLPVYNGERYLAESIQSCLDQTYQNWELIVVDDASTDATPALIAQFVARDDRVRSLRHATNKRLPAALNSGFAQARGDYLTWTSDDNRYRTDALATMASALAADPTVDYVYCDYDVIDEAGRYVQTNQAQTPDHFIQGMDAVPCFLYRRAVYEQLGGYVEDLFLAEDYEYWLRIFATRHVMRPLHVNVYEYRRHPQSLTDAHRGRTFAAAERALMLNLPKLSGESRTLRGQAYLHLASLASWQGKRLRALRYASLAMLREPLPLARKVVRYAARKARGRAARHAHEPAEGRS